MASGLNWLVSSVKTAQKTVQAAAKPSMRIWLLQTGSSMRESASLLKPTTRTFWVPQTTGSGLSGNIVAVHTYMGWLGYPMLLMQRNCCHVMTHLNCWMLWMKLSLMSTSFGEHRKSWYPCRCKQCAE